MKRNILYVYANVYFPMRSTWWERLRAFRRYSQERVFYLDLTRKNAPRYLRGVQFDLILFDTLFLTYTWLGADRFRAMMQRAALLKQSPAVKAILPQDEFMQSDLLCEFIREFDVQLVFSVAPETAWPKIYNKVDPDRVRFYRVLTSYFDEAKLPWLDALGCAGLDRSVDVGYRTPGATPYWFGRHGMLKTTIAEAFLQAARRKNLRLDISCDPRDGILGDDWYRFLARCKYTLGVESGTSLLDRNGLIRRQTESYVAQHPGATFEEVEQACFPGLDGQVTIAAISSRHLEACATRTCQILTSGDYNGILKPDLHYVEVKRDFSNLEEVLAQVVSDERRRELVERAHQDLVASGKFTYRSLVELVTQQGLAQAPRTLAPRLSAREFADYWWMRWVECTQFSVARGKGAVKRVLEWAGLPVTRWGRIK